MKSLDKSDKSDKKAADPKDQKKKLNQDNDKEQTTPHFPKQGVGKTTAELVAEQYAEMTREHTKNITEGQRLANQHADNLTHIEEQERFKTSLFAMNHGNETIRAQNAKAEEETRKSAEEKLTPRLSQLRPDDLTDLLHSLVELEKSLPADIANNKQLFDLNQQAGLFGEIQQNLIKDLENLKLEINKKEFNNKTEINKQINLFLSTDMSDETENFNPSLSQGSGGRDEALKALLSDSSLKPEELQKGLELIKKAVGQLPRTQAALEKLRNAISNRMVSVVMMNLICMGAAGSVVSGMNVSSLDSFDEQAFLSFFLIFLLLDMYSHNFDMSQRYASNSHTSPVPEKKPKKDWKEKLEEFRHSMKMLAALCFDKNAQRKMLHTIQHTLENKSKKVLDRFAKDVEKVSSPFEKNISKIMKDVFRPIPKKKVENKRD